MAHLTPFGKNPNGAALTPAGRLVCAGSLADNTVSVIDVASPKAVATIVGCEQPRQATVFTRDRTLAYVLSEDLSVSQVDCAYRQIVGTLAALKIEVFALRGHQEQNIPWLFAA